MANVGLTLDQELQHQHALLQLAEGFYVLHHRRGGAVLGQHDAIAAVSNARQQLTCVGLELTEADD